MIEPADGDEHSGDEHSGDEHSGDEHGGDEHGGDEHGGDPPCWSHLLDDDAAGVPGGVEPLVVDLGSGRAGSGGAVWSLPHGGDLDANLVRLDPGGEIGEHVNNDVDVLIFIQSGGASIVIDGEVRRVAADHLALIPRGARRSITAAGSGVTYLSVHRRRSPLGISGGGSPGDDGPA